MELLSWLRDMGLLVPHAAAKVLVVASVVRYTVFEGAVSRFIGSTLKHLKQIGIIAKTVLYCKTLTRECLSLTFVDHDGWIAT